MLSSFKLSSFKVQFKALFSPTFKCNSSSLQHYRDTPVIYQAPYHYLYDKIGYQKKQVFLDEFNWFLEEQRVKIVDDELIPHKPPTFNSTIDEQHSPSQFFFSGIEPQAYSACSVQNRVYNATQNKIFYWNHKLLSFYHEVVSKMQKVDNISGPQKIGKSFNLIFYNLLLRTYQSQQYKTIFVHNPASWYADPLQFLISELQMTFGEELSFEEHPLHSKARGLFQNVFNIAEKYTEKKYLHVCDASDEIILTLKPLLEGKKLIYLQDQTNLFKKWQLTEGDSQDYQDMDKVRDNLYSHSDKILYVTSMTDEALNMSYKDQGTHYSNVFFDLPRETALNMLIDGSQAQSNRNFTISEAEQILATTGYNTGQIGSFIQQVNQDEDLVMSLQKYSKKEVSNIQKGFDVFKSKRKQNDKKLIEEEAKRISLYILYDENKLLNKEFTDLRYFKFHFKNGQTYGQPLYPAVKLFYTKNFAGYEAALIYFLDQFQSKKFKLQQKGFSFELFMQKYFEQFVGNISFINSKGNEEKINLPQKKEVNRLQKVKLMVPSIQYNFGVYFPSSQTVLLIDGSIVDKNNKIQYLIQIKLSANQAIKCIEEYWKQKNYPDSKKQCKQLENNRIQSLKKGYKMQLMVAFLTGENSKRDQLYQIAKKNGICVIDVLKFEIVKECFDSIEISE